MKIIRQLYIVWLGLFVLGAYVCVLSTNAEGMNFPDGQSYQSVDRVEVAVISYEDMKDVALSPAEITRHVRKNLEQAGVKLHNGRQLSAATTPTHGTQTTNQSHDAIVGIRLRRTEDSALFGASKIGVVTVTVSLFQSVMVKQNQHSTHAITWSDSRSISGASKRPRKIFQALDELLAAFMKDFAPTSSQ